MDRSPVRAILGLHVRHSNLAIDRKISGNLVLESELFTILNFYHYNFLLNSHWCSLRREIGEF